MGFDIGVDRKMALAFVIGSSVVCTFVTFLYLGNAFKRSGCPCDISFEKVGLVVPVLYGLVNVLLVWLGLGWQGAVLVGTLFGFGLSLIGRFGLGLPRKLFGFIGGTEWRVHVIASVLYAGIFGVLVHGVDKWFGLV